MSFPVLKIVDIHHNDEEVQIEDLTDNAIGMLIADCVKQFVFELVEIEGDKAIGTDGKRLHIYQNSFFEGCEQGLWEVLKQTRTTIDLMPAFESGNFPEYEQIIPKDYTEYFEQSTSNPPEKSVLNALYGFHGKNIGIDIDFLDSLCVVETRWTFWFNKPDRPILAKAEISEGESCMAVIMPYVLATVEYQTTN